MSCTESAPSAIPFTTHSCWKKMQQSRSKKKGTTITSYHIAFDQTRQELDRTKGMDLNEEIGVPPEGGAQAEDEVTPEDIPGEGKAKYPGDSVFSNLLILGKSRNF
mmetsp:Transcript_46884/g.92283  ORF Transcript_46884/g.92283 Transcript_46884/m.92283 type:complete len:106 (+) Transcript_46884:326-643(+)